MKKEIAIIGGGSCALFLANEIDTEKYLVSVYERNATPGRKFLVAGHGGLNLTHSEPAQQFVEKYTPASFLAPAFLQYDNTFFREWLLKLGIATKVGSSGRVFPDGKIKPAQVLEILRKRAEQRGVKFNFKSEWQGFDTNNQSIILFDGIQKSIASQFTVCCLGGASWPVTGSTGSWQKHFEKLNISTPQFQASNCEFLVTWPTEVKEHLAGKPLKNCLISTNSVSRLGELVITANGIEGSGVYPLSAQVREQLKSSGRAELKLDLKPTKSLEAIEQVLSQKTKQKSISERLKNDLALSTSAVKLLKALSSKDDFSNPKILAGHIKNLPLQIVGLAPIDEAISTVGGIGLQEVDENFQLNKLPRVFVIGEMLDFDAPTGGYLLQACFSMAMHLASFLNTKKN